MPKRRTQRQWSGRAVAGVGCAVDCGCKGVGEGPVTAGDVLSRVRDLMDAIAAHERAEAETGRSLRAGGRRSPEFQQGQMQLAHAETRLRLARKEAKLAWLNYTRTQGVGNLVSLDMFGAEKALFGGIPTKAEAAQLRSAAREMNAARARPVAPTTKKVFRKGDAVAVLSDSCGHGCKNMLAEAGWKGQPLRVEGYSAGDGRWMVDVAWELSPDFTGKARTASVTVAEDALSAPGQQALFGVGGRFDHEQAARKAAEAALRAGKTRAEARKAAEEAARKAGARKGADLIAGVVMADLYADFRPEGWDEYSGNAKAPGIGKESTRQLLELDPATVYPDPTNERDEIGWDHVDDIAESMRTNGYLPELALTVRRVPAQEWHAAYAASARAADPAWVRSVRPETVPTTGEIWQIVGGEHRLHAAKLAGVNVVAHKFSGTAEQAKALQVSENTGKPWTERELAKLVYKLTKKGLTAEAIKKQTGKKINWVTARMQLARLPKEALETIPYASIGSLVGLASLYDLVGKQNLPDTASVDRVVASAIADWNTAGRPSGYFERIVEEWQGLSGQFMAFGGSPVPTDDEIQQKEMAALISRYRENVGELTSAIRHSLAQWQQANPGKAPSEFVAAAAQRAGTRVSSLLDRLGVADQATRELLCTLCVEGDESAACQLCARAGECEAAPCEPQPCIQPPAVAPLLSRAMPQHAGVFEPSILTQKVETIMSKKTTRKASKSRKGKPRMYRTKDGKLTTKARYMAGRRLAALNKGKKRKASKPAKRKAAKRPAAQRAATPRPVKRRKARKPSQPQRRLLAVVINGKPIEVRYSVKRWLQKGQSFGRFESTTGKDVILATLHNRVPNGVHPTKDGWKLYRKAGGAALVKLG